MSTTRRRGVAPRRQGTLSEDHPHTPPPQDRANENNSDKANEWWSASRKEAAVKNGIGYIKDKMRREFPAALLNEAIAVLMNMPKIHDRQFSRNGIVDNGRKRKTGLTDAELIALWVILREAPAQQRALRHHITDKAQDKDLLTKLIALEPGSPDEVGKETQPTPSQAPTQSGPQTEPATAGEQDEPQPTSVTSTLRANGAASGNAQAPQKRAARDRDTVQDTLGPQKKTMASLHSVDIDIRDDLGRDRLPLCEDDLVFPLRLGTTSKPAGLESEPEQLRAFAGLWAGDGFLGSRHMVAVKISKGVLSFFLMNVTHEGAPIKRNEPDFARSFRLVPFSEVSFFKDFAGWREMEIAIFFESILENPHVCPQQVIRQKVYGGVQKHYGEQVRHADLWMKSGLTFQELEYLPWAYEMKPWTQEKADKAAKEVSTTIEDSEDEAEL